MAPHPHAPAGRPALSYAVRGLGLLMVLLPFTSLLGVLVLSIFGEREASIYCFVAHAISTTWLCSTMWAWARTDDVGRQVTGLGRWTAFPIGGIFGIIVFSFSMLRLDDHAFAVRMGALASSVGIVLGFLSGTFCA